MRRGGAIAGRQPRAEHGGEATGDRVADSGRVSDRPPLIVLSSSRPATGPARREIVAEREYFSVHRALAPLVGRFERRGRPLAVTVVRSVACATVRRETERSPADRYADCRGLQIMTHENKIPHFLRFSRAIALVGSLAAFASQGAGCAASVGPTGDGGDSSVACTCCPTFSLTGVCPASYPDGGAGAPLAPDSSAESPQDSGSMRMVDAGPQPIDAGTSPQYLDPPAGSRWCTAADRGPNGGTLCPVAGPLAPPELDA